MKRAAPAALLVLIIAAACGKVGDPKAPILRTPQPVGDLRAAQSGYHMTLSWTNPARYIDNNGATDLATVHILRNGVEIAEQPVKAPGQPQSYDVDVSANVNEPLIFTVKVETQRGRTSALSNALNIQPLEVPGLPRGLRAEVDKLRIVLDWEAPENNPGLVGGYLVQRSDRPTPVPVTTTHYEDADYDADKKYDYTVTAARGGDVRILGVGGTAISVVATDTKPPAVPEGLQVDALAPGVFLRWRANTERDLKEYIVYRSDQTAPWKTTSVEGIADLDYRPGLSYQVAAEDRFGNRSDRSAPQSGP